jgi:hypothetical protein
MKKGQAAFEFLMTYGWALLIIGIVVGILYHLNIFTPGSYIKPQVFGFAGFMIEDWKLSGDGRFLIILRNEIDHDVEVQKVFIDKKLTATFSPGVQLAPGASGILSDIMTDKQGKPGISSYRLTAIIEYEDLITSKLHNDTGTFIGRFE